MPSLTPRMAASLVFLCFGVVAGLWGGSLPEVARAAHADPRVLGSAFVGYSAAGILAFAIVGRIGRSISLKTRLIAALFLTACCAIWLYHVSSAQALTVGLFIYAFIGSSIDMVMNSEAIAVERDAGKPVLSSFHGLASLGMAIGAFAGSYLSVVFGVTVTSAVAVAIYGVAILAVLLGTPDRGATQPVGTASWFRPELALVAVALIVGTSIAGEQAALLFSTKAITDQTPTLAAYAGVGASTFALCQCGVRLVGDRLRAAFGDARLMLISLITSCTGLVIIAASSGLAMSVAGLAIVGVGTACLVPCGFAMGSKLTAHSAAAAISMVAIISGIVRIPAPLFYGLAAERIGTIAAYGVYACIFICAIILAQLVLANSAVRRPA